LLLADEKLTQQFKTDKSEVNYSIFNLVFLICSALSAKLL